jgi:hypothetical protein
MIGGDVIVRFGGLDRRRDARAAVQAQSFPDSYDGDDGDND